MRAGSPAMEPPNLSSEPSTPPSSDLDHPSGSEKPTLGSPFHSPGEEKPNVVVTPTEVAVVDPSTSCQNNPQDIGDVKGLHKSATEVEVNVAVSKCKETVTQASEHAQFTHSVPPHMRSDFQSPATRQPSLQSSKARQCEEIWAFC
jgi:hypothetical protein